MNPSHQQFSNQKVTFSQESKLRISFEELLLSQIESSGKKLTNQTGFTIERELQPAQTRRKLLSASLTLLVIFIVLATLVFGRWENDNFSISDCGSNVWIAKSS